MADLPTFGFDDVLPEPPGPQPTFNLTVELVPQTSWGANLRSALPKADWDRLRKKSYRMAGYRCEVCGGKGPKHPIECHEVWGYDDETHVQTLVGLVALCPSCHEVKHFGRAEAMGRGQRAFDHLQQVNCWTTEHTLNHLQGAAAQWQERSCHDWILDLTWLERHGVAVPDPPEETYA